MMCCWRERVVDMKWTSAVSWRFIVGVICHHTKCCRNNCLEEHRTLLIRYSSLHAVDNLLKRRNAALELEFESLSLNFSHHHHGRHCDAYRTCLTLSKFAGRSRQIWLMFTLHGCQRGCTQEMALLTILKHSSYGSGGYSDWLELIAQDTKCCCRVTSAAPEFFFITIFTTIWPWLWLSPCQIQAMLL